VPALGAWDADAAVARCPTDRLAGSVWRAHRQIRPALDYNGYRYASGRFHCGFDLFEESETWPALYTSLGSHVAMGEFTRHVRNIADLSDVRLTRIRVSFASVVDCRDLGLLGVTHDALLEDTDYTIGQQLARAVVDRRHEGMLIPSATRYPEGNLVIFPFELRPVSGMEEEEHVDPHLYVPR
jgi:hypothetical protein